MGSWKIIPILLPLMFLISSPGRVSRSWPWNNTCPSILACRELMSPITVRKVTLLPEPDSPTTPRVSPGLIENETPSTALTRPSSVGKETRRSLTSSRGSGIRGHALVGVEGVAEPVAEEVHAERGEQDHQPREPQEPRCGRDLVPG